MENMGEDYPKISCSDNRDQNPQTYKIVKIGTQTWMAENLNYNSPKGDSWCYDNNQANCSTYGRLYDWATAMDLPKTCNSNRDCNIESQHQGICPEGWHLPSETEWLTLVNSIDDLSLAGTKLKAKSPAWNGTDNFGFNALPGGSHIYNNTDGSFSFSKVSYFSRWWTIGESSESGASYRLMDNNAKVLGGSSGKRSGNSVRCVMDN